MKTLATLEPGATLSYFITMKTNELASKLAMLRKKDGWRLFRKVRYRIFGSIAHHYKLNRTLREKDIRAFEEAHYIELPTEYRNFLSKMGNGGAGPGYGIFPIEKWNLDLATYNGFLAKPFPHKKAWNMEQAFDLEDENFFESAAYQHWETSYYDDEQLTGSMRICHNGYGVYTLLVVSGVEAGNVWIDDRAGENGIYPLQTPSEERVGFNSWYSKWLNESLDSLEQFK
ncbi:SMI1/KNR4 family protein SUKH-1 [Chitinophaga skermanii]|uniref:SMI1/KNR4 family protein SUKH-1 n=1 Tax=Chitinophaga skermanii TaxID=331697 RepID=A0A327Q0Q0_9BACT|nr:SMI1/KNR4 family protein [Chitinophaga skermanii]RAI97889.1 SMI1/KNR4 family protein SUKH-1 [Chitinophaga skermanii]